MRRTVTILATAVVATCLLTVAAEARGGGHRSGAQLGNDRMYSDGIGQNAMRRYDYSYPVFDRDYDPSCDNDWMPKQMWASSCS